MDEIQLNRMAFYGYHGFLAEETKLGQRFYVDLILELDLQPAGQSDDLQKTVNYQKIYDTVATILEGTPVKLLETLAETTAQRLFANFSAVRACCVKIIKPDPPIPGHYDSVAVQIRRERRHD